MTRPRASRLKPNARCWCGSGKKLKKCHRSLTAHGASLTARKAALPSPLNRGQPIFTATGPRVTFEGLTECVRELEHTPEEVVLTLLELARHEIGPLGVDMAAGGDRFHVWQVGAAILAAFGCMQGPLQLPSQRAQRLAGGELIALLTRAGGLAAASRIAEGETASEQERQKIILRTMCTRSSLQRDFTHQFALTLHLLGLWDVERGQSGVGYCDQLFAEEYECSSRDYAEMLFTLWAMSVQGVVLPLDFTESVDPGRHAALAHRLMLRLACSAGDVATRLHDGFALHEADGMVQAWFVTHPFVAVANGAVLAPPLPFLRLLAGSGVFYEALRLARGSAERSGSSKPFTNQYSSEMGLRFEGFMGFLLGKARVSTETLWKEYEYLRNGNQKSPDFFITSEASADVLVVQAKLKRLLPGAFYGFSTDDFRKDASGALAELLWKSIRYLYVIHKTPDDQLEPTHRPLHDIIRKAARLVLLGVVPVLPSLFQADEFRSLVLAGVTEHLNEAERSWLAENGRRLMLWHILDAEEICGFVAAREEAGRAGERLCDALRLYLDTPGFGDLARPDGILVSFRDWYFNSHCGGAVKGRIRELRDVFDAFCQTTTEKFFGATTAALPKQV